MSFSVLHYNCLSLFKNLISDIALPFILFISHCANHPKLRGVFALLSNKGCSPTDLCQLATPIPVFSVLNHTVFVSFYGTSSSLHQKLFVVSLPLTFDLRSAITTTYIS